MALYHECVMVKQPRMTGIFPFTSRGEQFILRNAPMCTLPLRATSVLPQKLDVSLLLVLDVFSQVLHTPAYL